MDNREIELFLNRFAVKSLKEDDLAVHLYEYRLTRSPEPGSEYGEVEKILWKLKTPAARLDDVIVTGEKIGERYLQDGTYELSYLDRMVLDSGLYAHSEVLTRLERRKLERSLKEKAGRYRVERSPGAGFILWNEGRTILQDTGWELHSGVKLDISIDADGVLFLEIDSHHHFYTDWRLTRWLETYPDIPPERVKNTYGDGRTWKFARVSDEDPSTLIVPDTPMSLADYHRKLSDNPATEGEIRDSLVVYVKNDRGQELSHLSERLRPSIDMDVLSRLASERGQEKAARVFRACKLSVASRFDNALNTARWICREIYGLPDRATKLNCQKVKGISFGDRKPFLLTRNRDVSLVEASLQQGCFQTGETRFGCLNLSGERNWPPPIEAKLLSAARNSGVEVFLEEARTEADFPDSPLERKRFWRGYVERGIHSVLVVSERLGDARKAEIRRSALEFNIALQFMLPMPRPDNYRAVNIVLGLLVKAKWQPVGLAPLKDERAAEVVIGFDAGSNRRLFYGTCAFAVLANGRGLGWELPEAQPGERLSGSAVRNAVTNVVFRFSELEGRLPKRLLILRDGFVRETEFGAMSGFLESEGIGCDILEVKKTGAGRMARYSDEPGVLRDASPGTAVFSKDGRNFRLVTSAARAGGSARPLQVSRYYGDSPLPVLALQLYRLTFLNPLSGFSSCRLPNVLHFADKMAKTVQGFGEVGFLRSVERERIFFS